MKLKRTASSVGLTLFLSATLAACGGSDRPSAAEVSTVIQAEGTADAVPKEVADCVAEIFVASDVSDLTLQKAVNSNGEYFEDRNLPQADQDVLEDPVFLEQFSTCFEEGTEGLPDDALPGGDATTDVPTEGADPGDIPELEPTQPTVPLESVEPTVPPVEIETPEPPVEFEDEIDTPSGTATAIS